MEDLEKDYDYDMYTGNSMDDAAVEPGEDLSWKGC